MRTYTRFRFFRPLRAAVRLILCGAVVIPSLAGAQKVTSNQFVGAKLSDGGTLTIYKGNPANRELLTFIDHSYLTLKIEGLYYSNNPWATKIGPDGTPKAVDVFLNGGQTSKIGDTLRVVWKESGFDIVQDAYPVQFSSSGVIVLSIKIVNHKLT